MQDDLGHRCVLAAGVGVGHVRGTAGMPVRPTYFQRFSLGTAAEGYEVIDSDGRAVTEAYVDAQVASEVKDYLNEAFASGPKRLCAAPGELA